MKKADYSGYALVALSGVLMSLITVDNARKNKKTGQFEEKM